MAAKKKGKVVAKAVVHRKADHLYFVDGKGDVREVKRNTKGGIAGRRVCSK